MDRNSGPPDAAPGDSRRKHAAGVTFHDVDDETTTTVGRKTPRRRTRSEDTDDDDDVGGETRRDKADGEPRARIRQSPRLAELGAQGATATPMPHSNTITHRGRAASNPSVPS